jgi:hypothetical protein
MQHRHTEAQTPWKSARQPTVLSEKYERFPRFLLTLDELLTIFLYQTEGILTVDKLY